MDQAHALDLGRSTIEQEVQTLQSLAAGLGPPFWTACRLIAECPGVVWVTGVGTSAAVGMRLAHILSDCGVRAVHLSPDLGLHGHCGAMAAGEVLVAVSRGGESAEVIQMVEIANGLGVTTLGMVTETGSRLAQLCRHVLPVPSPAAFELGGWCATASSVASSAMGDAISAVVLEMKGYTLEAFRRTHPGGAVGRRLGAAADEAGGSA